MCPLSVTSGSSRRISFSHLIQDSSAPSGMARVTKLDQNEANGLTSGEGGPFFFPEDRPRRLVLIAMIHSIQQMREASPAFRHVLLKSEKKRIVGVIAFVSFFAILAAVRIFVLGSAMSAWTLVAAALVIAFELGLFRAVNRSVYSGKDISNFVWYFSSVLECLFPAVGVAFLASTRLLPDYRPLATPWVLAFFPFILLSVLRLTPRLCWVCGIVSALAYLTAAYVVGWHFSPGPSGFTVTQTAVKYFAFLLLITGALAAGVAAEIRTHVEAALHEAETKHQLKQVEHELQIARSIQQSLLPGNRLESNRGRHRWGLLRLEEIARWPLDLGPGRCNRPRHRACDPGFRMPCVFSSKLQCAR